MIDISAVIRLTVQAVPDVRPFLKGRSLGFVFNIDTAYKTQEFFTGTIEHLVKQVYNGHMQSEFIDLMANLIKGQLTDAYVKAWEDDNNVLPLPEYLASSLNYDILHQYDFIDGYYKDIVNARELQNPIAPLISRASLWGNRWKESFNRAVSIIAENEGEKLQWVEGDTEEKCRICVELDGIVAYASEWNKLKVHPQDAPNPALKKDNGGCGGWKCGCELKVVNRRRSPKAYDKISKIVQAQA